MPPIFVAGVLQAMLRLTRRWNQTGQKFAGESDIARRFFPAHNLVMWIAVVSTYLDITFRLSRRGFRRLSPGLSTLLSSTLCLVAFAFKMAFTNAEAPELLTGLKIPFKRQLESTPLVTQARAIFTGLGLSLAYTVIAGFRKNKENDKPNDAGGAVPGLPTCNADFLTGFIWVFHDLLALMLVTQSRIANIPMFLLFELQLHLLGTFDLSTTEITITSLLFQYTSFFAFGGSNAISSVDLSNAYNGIGGYNVLAVGILTFVSNWAGPIWWTSATTILLLRRRRTDRMGLLFHHLTLLTLFAATSVLFVMAACSTLRTHLFIWTVFSPKYLYIMAWSLAQHLCINLAGVSLFFWAGSR
ncbi:MAG: major facilitator super transporter protein [Pleopsidium flavum]|nr:MAG: major facilitator super transporter protein [Pleopsidium flavum]